MTFVRAIVAGLIVVGFAAIRPDVFMRTRDFVEYYTAARVVTTGGDPYDAKQLLTVQREVTGNPELAEAVSLWTPPWTLAIYLPFGFLKFEIAHILWIFVQASVIALSVDWLWRTFGGTPSLWPVPYLAAFLFSPVLWNLHYGQNTGFLLLGVAGYLRFRDTRPFVAGLFVGLTAIKPHLLALFGMWLICDALSKSGRKTLFAGVMMLIAGSMIALSVQPNIFHFYVESLSRPRTPEAIPLSQWQLPLLSYHFRMSADEHRFAWQFVPVILACVGSVFLISRYAQRSAYDSHAIRCASRLNGIPLVVGLSLLVAPYGGWIFDLTLLLVLVIDVLARIKSVNIVLAFVSVIVLVIISYYGLMIEHLQDPWWFTPGILGIWFGVRSVSDYNRLKPQEH